VSRRKPPAICHATYQRREYNIPADWITGFRYGAVLRGVPAGVGDAVAYWAQHEAHAELVDDEGEAP
jgi:hypothetical protein